MGNLMLLKHICNLSHPVETTVILGLTHINATHTINRRTPQTASVQCQMRVYIFLGTKLCLNAQILPFIYFDSICVCAYIPLCPLPQLNPITIAAAAAI